MRHIFTFLSVVIASSFTFAQDYFQQEVNYKIDVKLDDQNHMLRGFEYIEYYNNSSDTLNVIKMHLWPNAYKNASTALAKQKQRRENNGLIFAEEVDRGWIDSLDFKADGKALVLTYDEEHIDVATLTLNEALLPGEKVIISTPFKVKLPDAKYSRLGHVGESYMITQWYPKPAVYDKDGWHAMPYLNQGEFYSEYGSFEVSITLPKNYVVGATGDLQNPSEKAWLKAKADSTLEQFKAASFSKGASMDFPASSKEYKTLTYKQSKVHDFAWFADKRFEVLQGEVELPHSKRKVTTYAMFTPKNRMLWEDAIEYINDGTYYYSLWNGDYPYNQVTAVDGTIAAGGGMEYPNVTVIGNTGNKEALEVVIVHEVGHNWFYGILGSNERTHPWMDEGLNTLNEVRYIQTKYPNNTRLADNILNGKFRFHGCDYHDQNDVMFRTVQALGLDQPMDLHSDEFASMNYGIIVYQKTGLVFDYLKEYLGEEKFDAIMHSYYQKWKFKHPQPEDLRACFETATGEDFGWVFEDIIKTADAIDYKLKRVKSKDGNTEVVVKHKGHIHGPIPVQVITPEGDTLVKWATSEDRKESVTFENTEAAEVVVDLNTQVPEMNRTNNSWKKDWLINRVEPLKINPLFTANRREESNLAWTPAIGFNTSDKFMIGASLHNFQVVPNKFTFLLTPMYSIGRQNLSGMGELIYTFRPSNVVRLGKAGLSMKTFKDVDSLSRNNANYYALNPYLNLTLGKRGLQSKHHNRLLLQGLYKMTRRTATNIDEIGAFADYKYTYKRPNHLFVANARASYIQSNLNDEMARASVEVKYKWNYYIKKKRNYIELRAFALNNFIYDVNSAYNANRYAAPVSGRTGAQDLFMEEYYFGRNEVSGMWANQHNNDMGGFGSASGLTANESMVMANFYAPLPILTHVVGVFADYGLISNNGVQQEVYDLGLGIRMGEVFGIYFPIVQSANLQNSNYGQSIKFSLKLNLTNAGLIEQILDK